MTVTQSCCRNSYIRLTTALTATNMQLVILNLLLLFAFVDLHILPPTETKCRTDAYPGPAGDKVDDVVINLDLEPEERWKEIAVKMKPQLINLLQEIKNFTNFVLDGKLFYYIDKYLPVIASTLPDPYGRELKGIATATGLPLGEVVLYNIFYEVFTVCTSIVAETPEGKLYHARNLDFGLFLGWDVVNDTWALSEALRPLILNFHFQRGGKTVYVITGFTGFVGAITGMKPWNASCLCQDMLSDKPKPEEFVPTHALNYRGVISLTMNERFVPDGGFVGLLEWLVGERDSRWVTFLARDLLDSTTSFDMASNALSNTKILAPCYYILGGNSSGEGIVITRERTKSLQPMSMKDTKEGWYVLQTNYDHWKEPLIVDDRRTPGKSCMNQMTQKNVGFEGLYNVLSTIPVLNKLTTYTVLMQVNSGKLESYRRYCKDPCFPW